MLHDDRGKHITELASNRYNGKHSLTGHWRCDQGIFDDVFVGKTGGCRPFSISSAALRRDGMPSPLRGAAGGVLRTTTSAPRERRKPFVTPQSGGRDWGRAADEIMSSESLNRHTQPLGRPPCA